MGDKYGFLTPTQRDYLRGEKDLDDYSNPSQFKKRIRQRIQQAQRDWELLNESEVMDEEELQRALRNINHGKGFDKTMVPDEIQEATKAAGKAQAHATVGKELDPLIDTMEYVASEEAQRERKSKEVIVDAVESLLSGIVGFDTEQMSEWIRLHWPSKDFAINYIERKHDD